MGFFFQDEKVVFLPSAEGRQFSSIYLLVMQNNVFRIKVYIPFPHREPLLLLLQKSAHHFGLGKKLIEFSQKMTKKKFDRLE